MDITDGLVFILGVVMFVLVVIFASMFAVAIVFPLVMRIADRWEEWLDKHL
jgi:hypothetical protein